MLTIKSNFVFFNLKTYLLKHSVFIKYSIVGGSNTLITYVSFYIMSNFLGIHYVIATIIGYILGIINSYFWNKFWTFKKYKKSLNEFLKFVSVYLFAFTINVGSIVFLKESLYVSPNIGEIVGILFAMIVSYSGQRFWTFKYEK